MPQLEYCGLSAMLWYRRTKASKAARSLSGRYSQPRLTNCVKFFRNVTLLLRYGSAALLYGRMSNVASTSVRYCFCCAVVSP